MFNLKIMSTDRVFNWLKIYCEENGYSYDKARRQVRSIGLGTTTLCVDNAARGDMKYKNENYCTVLENATLPTLYIMADGDSFKAKRTKWTDMYLRDDD